jgi:hypothetical protein
MRIAPGWVAVAAVAALGGGCAGGASTTAPGWTYGPPATSTTGAPAPLTPPPVAGTSRFTGYGITLDYPSAWNRSSFEVVSSFFRQFLFLSTATLADPCDRTPSSVSCTRQAVAGLGPDGILVIWSSDGFPGWSFDATAGSANPVGGRTATLTASPADDACRAIGGEELMVATIPIPDVRWDWHEMRACLRGPDLASLRSEVRAMLGSVRWTSP